mgnify:FL=1
MSLSIEIEKRIRAIAIKNNLIAKHSLTKLINDLRTKEILSQSEMAALKDIVGVLNNAAHGQQYDYRTAEWVLNYGPKILKSLDEKL